MVIKKWIFQNFVTHLLDEVFFLKTWCISMIFLSWERHKLHSAFCPHVLLVNLLISLRQYFFFPSYIFWRILTKTLCKYVGTLWVQGHGSLFKTPQRSIRPNYQSFLVVQAFYLWKIVPHLLFQGIGLWWLYICALGFVFLINPFWKSMFLNLRGAHTSFNYVFVQLEIIFLP